MDIAFLLYKHVTALDFVGPYQVLATLADARIHLVAREAGPISTDTGLQLVATSRLEDVPRADIVVVPGTGRIKRVMDPECEEVAWLRQIRPHVKWMTSVCTGSLMLANAGFLTGKRATTHWLARDVLRSLGAECVAERVVVDGDIITAAGVSAGIDMALQLIALEKGAEAAQVSQLRIEYDPAPPFQSGSPETAPAEIVSAATQIMLARNAPDAGSGSGT
jgi:transcriptional regulator GlxA family with amidase domain